MLSCSRSKFSRFMYLCSLLSWPKAIRFVTSGSNTLQVVQSALKINFQFLDLLTFCKVKHLKFITIIFTHGNFLLKVFFCIAVSMCCSYLYYLSLIIYSKNILSWKLKSCEFLMFSHLCSSGVLSSGKQLLSPMIGARLFQKVC